jgi:hypothetical protein
MEKKTDPIVELIKRHVDNFQYEMQNNRHDGWIQNHYRDCLIEIREYINKALDK